MYSSQVTAPINTVAWSADGSYIASGGQDHTVRVWNAETGNEIYVYTGHAASIKALGWAPDSKRIASGSRESRGEDGTRGEKALLHIWDALTGEQVVSCSGDLRRRVYDLAWSPDGKYIAACDIFHQLHIYDASTGEAIAQVQDQYHSNRGELLSIAWSPDGEHIAAGFSSGMARVWPVGA